MDTDNLVFGGMFATVIIIVIMFGFIAYSDNKNEHELKLKCLDKNMAYIDKKCFPVMAEQ